jgi:hypothetical protein
MSEAANNTLAFDLDKEIDERILLSLERIIKVAKDNRYSKESEVLLQIANVPVVQDQLFAIIRGRLY